MAKYKVTLELTCEDVHPLNIKETLSVDVPESNNFKFTVVSIEPMDKPARKAVPRG
jgi:hypothetical protein